MNHESPKVPHTSENTGSSESITCCQMATGGKFPDTPPDSCQDDGTPIEEQLPLYDVDAIKVNDLGCFPMFYQPPESPSTSFSGFRYIGRFSTIERSPSQPHLWPPRPSSTNTIEEFSHNMKITVLPEIQLPVDCFRVFSDGTLFIEKGFGKEITRTRLAGRYKKPKLSFGEHVQRVKRAVAIWNGEEKEQKSYSLQARIDEERFRAVLSGCEAPDSTKRPILPMVDCPRRSWTYTNHRRVYLEHAHFTELNIPESVVDSDEVQWGDTGIMIRPNTGRKLLGNSTLFVPEDDPVLSDFAIFIAEPVLIKENAEGESTLSEVDIVKYHLSRGGWMWVYQTNRLHDPDINIALTEDYEIARYYHVSKGGVYLIKKLCDGMSLTRNDRAFLHRFDIARIQCVALLTYAKILCKMEEKTYKPELTDVRVAIPAHAKIDGTRESRISQTLKGQPIRELPPPVNLEAVLLPSEETPPESADESSEEYSGATPRRISRLFTRKLPPPLSLEAAAMGAEPISAPSPPPSPQNEFRRSSLFSRRASRRSSKDFQSEVSSNEPRRSWIFSRNSSKRSSKSSMPSLPSSEPSNENPKENPSENLNENPDENTNENPSEPPTSENPKKPSSEPPNENPNDPPNKPRKSWIFSRNRSSTSSQTTNPSKPKKRSKRSKTDKAKKRLRKLKRKITISLTPPKVDYKGKALQVPRRKTRRTYGKKQPLPKYGEPTPVTLQLGKPTSSVPSLHDSESETSTAKESEYLLCPPCTQDSSGMEHKGLCRTPWDVRVDWMRYPDWHAIRREEEVERLRGMRLRIWVKRNVFVRVKGGSFDGGRGGDGLRGSGGSSVSLGGLGERGVFDGGECVTTIWARRMRSSSNSRPEAVTPKKQTLTARLQASPQPPPLQPPKPQSSTTNTPKQVAAPASKHPQQTTANTSTGNTPSLRKLPSSRSSSMSLGSEGLGDVTGDTLRSLENLAVFGGGGGLD